MKKSLLLSVLLAIAFFGLYKVVLSDADSLRFIPEENFVVNAETSSIANYSDEVLPLGMGKLESSKRAYFHLKLRFRQDSAIGYPNLLQTAPYNSGLRIEIHNSRAAIIVADSSLKDGYRVLGFPNLINIGQWYKLEIEALNGGYVRASIDNTKVEATSNGLSMDVSQFLAGGGFDDSRRFQGDIANISLLKGNMPQWVAILASNIPRSERSLLSFVANIAILISLALYYFLIRLKKTKPIIVRLNKNLTMSPKMTVLVLIGLQIILMMALPVYKNVVITILFLYIVGINQHILITPSFLKDRYFYHLFVPFNGFLLVSVIGGYFIGFSIDTKLLASALLCMALLGYAFNRMFKKDEWSQFVVQFREDLPESIRYFSYIGTPLILCLIAPVLFVGYQTSSFRIGPDLASYAKMAQYLLDGGTWATAHYRSAEFLGMTPGEINRYSDATMSWPLMYYFRWGLTAYQVLVTNITTSKHVYETAFISMIIPHMLLSGLIMYWLRARMRLSIAVSTLGTLAFAVNSNVINLWYEGFYGNLFALCFFILILLIFHGFRVTPWGGVGKATKPILFLSLVFSASLLSYGEGVFFILPPFLGFVFIVDALLSRTVKWSAYLVIFGGALLGLLIVVPCDFIVNWAILTFKQISQEGGNGYMQPLWALPNEILGFGNIYLNATPDLAGKLLKRSFLMFSIGLVSSFLILYSLLLRLGNKRKGQDALYIVAIFVVAISAGLVYYKNPNNNYTYAKMYVFFLPILFVVFWESLTVFYEKHAEVLMAKNIFFLLLATPIAINGIVYILQYKGEATPVEKYKIDLHGEIKPSTLAGTILYPYSMTSNRVMYPAVLPFPWITPSVWDSDHWKEKPYYKNYINHKVYLFIEKTPGHSYEVGADKIKFENICCMIVDSGETVGGGIKSDDGSMDFETFTRSVKEIVSE